MSGVLRSEELRRMTRDRTLLYAGSLDVPAEIGLDLALEGLSRSGSSSPKEAMESLWDVLEERKESIGTEKSIPRASVPPLNRAVMVSEEMDLVPWKTAIVRALRSWWDDLFGLRR
ncbi:MULTISPECIES: hypothetical protein [Dethiosulfovibrio]|nr:MULTISPECIES: hypothetical protein [Dethiosulfovibrio]MCF4113293.1 hypothetical protein [Dethiosulfovibrio russensis]MCF4142357.1 hypothetical protein [Dethiosulfovibrio marinus]MCF4145631.1 hypothetical protein [Dethiosulfovibrio acidaminovorans]MEA3285732.1 hypothetical protein [Synergistota bacterium]